MLQGSRIPNYSLYSHFKYCWSSLTQYPLFVHSIQRNSAMTINYIVLGIYVRFFTCLSIIILLYDVLVQFMYKSEYDSFIALPKYYISFVLYVCIYLYTVWLVVCIIQKVSIRSHPNQQCLFWVVIQLVRGCSLAEGQNISRHYFCLIIQVHKNQIDYTLIT